MLTIEEIYAKINPLPAMLSAKGRVSPELEVRIEANAGIGIMMSWKKPHVHNDWEKEYEYVSGEDFNDALHKTVKLINELPSAEQAKLQHFMGKLGKLIDAGREDGIAVDYMNPLLDTMKRLSENVITYKPESEPIPY